MKKPLNEPTTYTLEVGMVSAILGEIITDKLREKMQKEEPSYIGLYEVIAYKAIDFLYYHEKNKTDLIGIRETGYKPLSKKMKSVNNWEEAVRDYAYSIEEKL